VNFLIITWVCPNCNKVNYDDFDVGFYDILDKIVYCFNCLEYFKIIDVDIIDN